VPSLGPMLSDNKSHFPKPTLLGAASHRNKPKLAGREEIHRDQFLNVSLEQFLHEQFK